MNWMLILGTIIGAGGISGIASSLLTGLVQRPKLRADVVSQLTDAALRQVNELQERTAEAEREATAARIEVAETRRQVRLLSAEVEACMARLRAWRLAILDPGATVERLRVMVSAADHTSNGRPD